MLLVTTDEIVEQGWLTVVGLDVELLVLTLRARSGSIFVYRFKRLYSAFFSAWYEAAAQQGIDAEQSLVDFGNTMLRVVPSGDTFAFEVQRGTRVLH